MMDPRVIVDGIMAEMRGLRLHQRALQSAFDAELDQLKRKYSELERVNDDLMQLDTELITLLKKQRDPIFGDAEKIKVDHGILIHTSAKQLTLPRDIVDRLRDVDESPIRVSYSVDRAILSQWTDDRLILVGARRRIQHKYAYQLKEVSWRPIKDTESTRSRSDLENIQVLCGNGLHSGD